ncbi:MAG: CBS domain-containing protein [Candidatus Pacearchaeota archaeon]
MKILDKDMTRIKVGDIMTRNFLAVRPNTSIIYCAKMMTKGHVSSMIIKEGQQLRGVLTEGDIIRGISRGIKLTDRVSKIMTKHVVTIGPSKDIVKALKLMKRKRIRWLPVVVKKNVIGLVTMKDILKIEPALSAISAQRIRIAEEREKKKRVRAVDEMKWVREGPCHECGVYDLLYKVEDRYLCENCKKRTIKLLPFT